MSEAPKYRMSHGGIVKNRPRATWHPHRWVRTGRVADAYGQSCYGWRCEVCAEERELFDGVVPKPTYGGRRP